MDLPLLKEDHNDCNDSKVVTNFLTSAKAALERFLNSEIKIDG
jgi:hypothetical protein